MNADLSKFVVELVDGGMSVEEIAKLTSKSVEYIQGLLDAGQTRKENGKVNISAEIRALAAEGYDRSTIRRMLSLRLGREISYQQVNQAWNTPTVGGNHEVAQRRIVAAQADDELKKERRKFAEIMFEDAEFANGSKRAIVQTLYENLRMTDAEIYHFFLEVVGQTITRQMINNYVKQVKDKLELTDRLTGIVTCEVCGKPLTDPLHKELGIGPKCLEAKMMGNKLVKKVVAKRKQA